MNEEQTKQQEEQRAKLEQRLAKLEQELLQDGSSSQANLDDRLAAIHSKLLKDNQSGIEGKGQKKLPQAELDKKKYTYRIKWNGKYISFIKRVKSGQDTFKGFHTDKTGSQAYMAASEVAYLQDAGVIKK